MEGAQLLFKTEKIEDCRQGKAQILSNIEIVEKIAIFLSKTLGPYGLDKMFYGKEIIITNDGATIMDNMKFAHPIGQLLTNLSKSQDYEVGDGTTSVVLLTAALLAEIKEFIRKNFDIELINQVFDQCLIKLLEKLESSTIEFNEEKLIKLVETTMTSKNIKHEKNRFATILVHLFNNDINCDLNIVKIPDGSIGDSLLVDGIAFEKTFTYAGYDQQPKKIINPKIACIDVELEWKSEKENAEIRINSVTEYQKVVDGEYKILEKKLQQLIDAGANVVLSSKSIGDYATQYFASKNVFSLGRVHDLKKIANSFGGKVSTTTEFLHLGNASLFEEKQLGNLRYNFFKSNTTKVKTLLLRGPGVQIVDEVERSINDAVCIVKNAIKSKKIVTGGGSTEMILSSVCRELYFNTSTKEKFLYKAFSRAFEKIPKQLSENFGLDPVLTIQQLRKLHHEGNQSFGITISGPKDMNEVGVYDLIDVKINMIKTAFATAKIILSIDGTIVKN